MRDEGTYNGKVRFYVVEVTSEAIRKEVESWEGLGNHGLVGTSASRELKVMLPGHEFGRSSIIKKVDELIAATKTR